MAKGIREKVEFTPADVKLYEMEDVVQPNGNTGVKFNQNKDKPVAFEFADEEIRLILKGITVLDKQKKITQDNLEIVLKFKNA